MSTDEPPLKYIFSPAILQKLDEKHGVSLDEVYECFENNDGQTLIEEREQHKTVPETEWFISQTRRGRTLKVCFVFVDELNTVFVKTAYDANDVEIRLFERKTS
jgi:uncharacterized DUF497 family protein